MKSIFRMKLFGFNINLTNIKQIQSIFNIRNLESTLVFTQLKNGKIKIIKDQKKYRVK